MIKLKVSPDRLIMIIFIVSSSKPCFRRRSEIDVSQTCNVSQTAYCGSCKCETCSHYFSKM